MKEGPPVTIINPWTDPWLWLIWKAICPIYCNVRQGTPSTPTILCWTRNADRILAGLVSWVWQRYPSTTTPVIIHPVQPLAVCFPPTAQLLNAIFHHDAFSNVIFYPVTWLVVKGRVFANLSDVHSSFLLEICKSRLQAFNSCLFLNIPLSLVVILCWNNKS
jgi:hypothetical protein